MLQRGTKQVPRGTIYAFRQEENTKITSYIEIPKTPSVVPHLKDTEETEPRKKAQKSLQFALPRVSGQDLLLYKTDRGESNLTYYNKLSSYIQGRGGYWK